MTTFMDQLNLRPQERRVVVVVMFLVFVVLNWMFVRPLFGQWGEVQDQLDKARRNLAKYEAEIAKAPTYQSLENKLKASGSDVLSEELQLQRLIDQYATAAGVQISRYAPNNRANPGRTNQFFEDQGLTVDFSAYSTNLVEFLVNLASGGSMVRVQEMNLRPDGTKTKLTGNILLMASYLKKQDRRAGLNPPAAAKPAAATPPATNRPKALVLPLLETNTPAATKKTNAPAPTATKALPPRDSRATNARPTNLIKMPAAKK